MSGCYIPYREEWKYVVVKHVKMFGKDCVELRGSLVQDDKGESHE